MSVAKVVAVCKSKKKGTIKREIFKGFLKEDYGLVGDAHAGFHSSRQVSLLAIESINRLRESGFDVYPGAFGENLTTQGLELASLSLGTRLQIGEEAVIEITQFGKECHEGCAIFYKTGRCIMPTEGIFARVLKSGVVVAGFPIKMVGD